MKRIGLKQEFHGESDACEEEWAVDVDSTDEVVLDIVGGTVSFAVPSSVPDDLVTEKTLADRFLCCTLKLENGAELNVWINEGANGVDLRLRPAKKNHAQPTLLAA